MSTLTYRPSVLVEELAVGECTMHPVSCERGRFWHLWFRVLRDTDGQPDVFCVPMNPGGKFQPDGVGGKTWGLTSCGSGTWQVSPSINVLNTSEVHPGPHPSAPSLWHQTPQIVGVPDSERWAKGEAA